MSPRARECLKLIMARACTLYDFDKWRIASDAICDFPDGLSWLRENGLIEPAKKEVSTFYVPTPLADQAVDDGLLD